MDRNADPYPCCAAQRDRVELAYLVNQDFGHVWSGKLLESRRTFLLELGPTRPDESVCKAPRSLASDRA